MSQKKFTTGVTKAVSTVYSFRTTVQAGVAQLLGVAICAAVLFLFVALTYSRITLPHYTTNYGQKDTQQVINLLVTVMATAIGILLSHCRRLTNEAETKSELRHNELSIPRLHIHFEAAGGSKTAMMGLPVLQNKRVWSLVLFYFIAMIIFAFMHSVLSVIFVVEPIIANEGHQVPAYIPIGVDIPWMYKGVVVDPCSEALAQPGCTYELALTSLTSALTTYQPFTLAGVTFQARNGTMGLPYYAMDHFHRQVRSSTFEEERRSYCLPVMDPHIVSCTEEPIELGQLETTSSLVRYTRLSAFRDSAPLGNASNVLVNDMYEVSIPYPTEPENIKYRISDQGHGTMLVRMFPDADLYNTTIITASDETGAPFIGYATILHNLMYGVDPDISGLPSDKPFLFAAKCEMTSIKYRDNYASSWRKVDFVLRNGASHANVTDERCPNPRGSGTSGFADLYFALEGASDILASTDGYSKLFNRYIDDSTGTDIFQNMSRLDAIMNKILHIASTSWTESIHHYAMLNETVYDEPVIMTVYPHEYIIRISWTPTTYIGLILSVLITINAFVLAARWAHAIYRFGYDRESTWNLLLPIDLMAYSLAAYHDLFPELRTPEQREANMRGDTETILKEQPAWERTTLSPVSTMVANSPISPIGFKMESPMSDRTDAMSPTVTVRDAEPRTTE